jgi:hypothetical protein
MLITWLPYPNFRLSVHVLDSQVLGTQVSNCIHLLRMIAGHRDGGRDRYHNTTLMWYHHPQALVRYTDYAIQEILLRGHDRGIPSPRSADGRKIYEIPKEWDQECPDIPEWVGVERIHASHRASLLQRDREWYAQFAWMEPPVRVLNWPCKMPGPGEAVMSESGEIRMVHSLDDRRRPVLITDHGLVPVERVDVYSGKWRRVIVA